jgi:hypothetical protein
MANDYFAWTVALPEVTLPTAVPALWDELPNAVSEVMGADALMTSSRNDWLHYGLTNAVAQFATPTLAFLSVDPYSLPMPIPVGSLQRDSGGVWSYAGWLVTVLHCADLSRAVEEIEAWLAMAESDPRRFATALADDWGDKVREEARRAVDLLEISDSGCEGDDPVSFFSFLKGLRSLLLSARSREFGIVHIRYALLFGK